MVDETPDRAEIIRVLAEGFAEGATNEAVIDSTAIIGRIVTGDPTQRAVRTPGGVWTTYGADEVVDPDALLELDAWVEEFKRNRRP